MVYLEISTLRQPRNLKRKGMQSIKMQLMQLICNKKNNMSEVVFVLVSGVKPDVRQRFQPYSQ